MGEGNAERPERHIEEWNARFSADDSTWVFGREPSELARTAMSFWRLLHGESRGALLDLGCGEGRDAVYYAKEGFHVTAVDGSVAGIRKLERLAAEAGVTMARLLLLDVRRFPLAGGFRLLHCNNCLQFLGAECVPYLRRLQEATPAGGVNAISVFTREAESLAGRADLYRFDRNELKFHYRDWRLLSYSEEILWREPAQNYLSFARLIAQKPPEENEP